MKPKPNWLNYLTSLVFGYEFTINALMILFISLLITKFDFSLLDYQEFDFADSNDEFMITLSKNNNINIYFWKSNSKSSIKLNELYKLSKSENSKNIEFKKDLDHKDLDHIEFRNKKAFGINNRRPWVINIAKCNWRSLKFIDVYGSRISKTRSSKTR